LSLDDGRMHSYWLNQVAPPATPGPFKKSNMEAAFTAGWLSGRMGVPTSTPDTTDRQMGSQIPEFNSHSG